MTVRCVLGALIAGVLCGACSLEAAEVESPRDDRWAVVGGEESPSGEDAVVRMNVSFGLSCTGTLIAPNVVVTALHCVSAFSGMGGILCNTDGTPLHAGSSGRIDATLEPSDIEVYFGARPEREPSAFGTTIFGSGSRTICSDNIALVVLDRDLPVRGLSIRSKGPVLDGEELTLIGYNLVEKAPLRRRRRHVPVLAVGPDVLSDEPSPAVPRAFLVGDGPCSGDAGGPALSEETGAMVGLFSFTAAGSSSDCEGGLRNLYTKIAPFSGLIHEALAAAGHTPLIEAEPSTSTNPPAEGGCSFALRPAENTSVLVLIAMLLLHLCATRRSRRISTASCGCDDVLAPGHHRGKRDDQTMEDPIFKQCLAVEVKGRSLLAVKARYWLTGACLLLASASCGQDDPEAPAGTAGRSGGESGVGGTNGGSSADAGSAPIGASGDGGTVFQGGASGLAEELMTACIRSCSEYRAFEKFLFSLPQDQAGNYVCEPGDLVKHGRLLGAGGASAEPPLVIDPECSATCMDVELGTRTCWEQVLAEFDCRADMTWFCASDGSLQSNDCLVFPAAEYCGNSR